MKYFFSLLILSCFALNLTAQITLPHVFSNHMVLQRETSIPIWGKAAPGTQISVKLADNTILTQANKLGKWEVKMPAMLAGGPFELSIYETNNPTNKIDFTDVLIGDVWLASGQSNMEWQVIQSEEADAQISKAFNSKIRYFNVPHNKSITPLENTLDASWQTCDSNSVKTMSAIAYYFAQKIEKDLDVPIGLLQTTWGGTPVEAWISREMLLSNDLTKQQALINDTVTPQHFINDSLDLIRFWDIVYQAKNGMDTIIPHSNYNDKDWKTVMVPGNIKEWELESYEGMIWLRKSIKLNADFIGKDLSINLGLPEMNYSVYFNGAEICKTQWNAKPSHSYTLPAELVKKGVNTISIRIAALWGGGALNPPADKIYLSNGIKQISLCGEWKYKKDLEPVIPKIYNYQYYPSYLFNAMINPIVPYGLKGFLWYQGEANDSAAYNYRHIFPMLINDWRIRWQQSYLPFIFMQLPNYMKAVDAPTSGNWAIMRESQARTLALPNTGMNCIIDLGDKNTIHPLNKIEPAQRLALVAEQLVYNKNIIACGPIYKGFTIENGTIRIHFAESKSKLTTKNNNAVKGFAIAGDDQIFYWANAVIEGNDLIISSNKVINPVAVRYAFENNPDCNLMNEAGLPAQPFRTDNWKVITQP